MPGLADCVASQPFSFNGETRELTCDFCGEVLQRGLDRFNYVVFGILAMGPAVEHMTRFGRSPNYWTTVYSVDSFTKPNTVKLWLAKERE